MELEVKRGYSSAEGLERACIGMGLGWRDGSKTDDASVGNSRAGREVPVRLLQGVRDDLERSKMSGV